MDLPQVRKAGIGWFRLQIAIDSLLVQQSLALLVWQTGATEVYINGKRYQTFGSIASNTSPTEAFQPQGEPIFIKVANQKKQCVAVRFGYQKGISYIKWLGRPNPTLEVWLAAANTLNQNLGLQELGTSKWLDIFKCGIFLILAVVHMALYLSYPKQKGNLLISFFMGIVCLAFILSYYYKQPSSYKSINNIIWTIAFINVLSILIMLDIAYILFKARKNWLYYSYWVISLASLVSLYLFYDEGWTAITFLMLIISFEVIRIGLRVNTEHKIIVYGAVTSVLFYIVAIYATLQGNDWNTIKHLGFNVSYLSMPISFSLAFALEFAVTHNALERQLQVTETLSTEKQQILTTQNETLERQVEQRTAELVGKNRDLEIEAALEKVRSRSLAMQKSTELRDVVRTVVERMTELGLNIASANIVLFSEQDRGLVSWTKTNTDDVYSNGFHWPYNDDPAVADFFDAIERRAYLFTKNFTFAEKNAFWKNNFERSDFRNVPADRKKFILDAAYFSLSLACRNKTGICLTRYTEEPFSDTDHDILQRFATVFEQAYTRFLDVQKAENQTREAQVEVALEWVRSRTMAMFRSDEFSEVTKLLFQQLTQLGGTVDRFSIGIFDEQRQIVQIWATDQAGNQVDRQFIARLDEKTTVQKVYNG